jgi:hypothetical protein
MTIKKERPSIRILDNAGSLSETDLQLIAGSDVLMAMLRNRKLLIVEDSDCNWTALLSGVQGFYHVRRIDQQKLYQVWFETPVDMQQFEKNLVVAKLSHTETV